MSNLASKTYPFSLLCRLFVKLHQSANHSGAGKYVLFVKFRLRLPRWPAWLDGRRVVNSAKASIPTRASVHLGVYVYYVLRVLYCGWKMIARFIPSGQSRRPCHLTTYVSNVRALVCVCVCILFLFYIYTNTCMHTRSRWTVKKHDGLHDNRVTCH